MVPTCYGRHCSSATHFAAVGEKSSIEIAVGLSANTSDTEKVPKAVAKLVTLRGAHFILITRASGEYLTEPPVVSGYETPDVFCKFGLPCPEFLLVLGYTHKLNDGV